MSIVCDPWVDADDLTDECTGDASPALIEWAVGMASDTLYLFSGRVYPGICADVVRPCAEPIDTNPPPSRISTRSAAFGWGPWTYFAGWGGCACGVDGSFGCCPANQVRMPTEPVVAVSQVRIDGVVVDPTTYRVDPPGWLVRLEGGWPCCQDLRLAATEVNTFEVAFTFGRARPDEGEELAALLACQLLAARRGGECALPKRVSSVVRQGITYAVLDPLTLFAEGRTGISEIDLWLGAVNPHKVKTPAKIWTPRTSARAHRTG